MLGIHQVLADGITIQLGDHLWEFGADFLVYLLVAAIVGFIAEFIVGWRLPFGFIGAIIAALVGVWLLTKVVIIQGIETVPGLNTLDQINISGVPILRALVGAILLVLIWHALTYNSWHGRSRRGYRRRYSD